MNRYQIWNADGLYLLRAHDHDAMAIRGWRKLEDGSREVVEIRIDPKQMVEFGKQLTAHSEQIAARMKQTA